MKRLIWLIVAVGALVSTAFAIADGMQFRSVKAVSATFSATTVSNLRTSTCTGTDGGTYATSRARYTGTAAGSDATLTGPATLDVSSFVNTTTGYGTVQGSLRIATANNGRTDASFAGVVSHGAFAGLAQGRAKGVATLSANISAAYVPATGITNGKLGGGTSGGDAVELVAGRCTNGTGAKPERVDVTGNTTAVSATSISAAGVTCGVPSDLSSFVTSHVQLGTRVELTCSVSNGVGTLARIEVKGASASSHLVHARRLP
jgi:hypothetical protein